MSVRQGNTIIAGGNSVTVDQALDINSPNAIANSAVTAGLNGKEPTITGAATTITTNNLAAARAVITDANGKVAASTVTSTELGYMHGVTSAVQTQLNGKEATITGAATTITGSNLTASRVVVSDANGKIDVSSTTSTELGYVHGVTSDIQTQINAKAADNAVVHLADAETISGVKTFSASPKVPTAGITSDDTTAASTAFVRDIMPAGVIVPFAGTTVPAGYLLCDGSAVSRTTYADLFAAIGTTYGAGDGNTTFNLPKLSSSHRLIEKQDPTSSSGNLWYRLYDDGWVEQGGYNYVNVGSGTSMNLPIQMASNSIPVSVASTNSYTSGTGTRPLNVEIDTQKVTIKAPGASGNFWCSWFLAGQSVRGASQQTRYVIKY